MADDPMIAALFGAALEVPFEEQAAFVRARCGGNQAVYGEVMELLSVDAERGPSAIDVAFRRDAWRGAVSFRAGHKVGRYEILDQIGEGGFAVVYLAQEDEVRRRVALKTLKAGMQTKLVLTR
ncbi:MAG: serine/threonine protein kinase, partial [Myxococcota bacterium]